MKKKNVSRHTNLRTRRCVKMRTSEFFPERDFSQSVWENNFHSFAFSSVACEFSSSSVANTKKRRKRCHKSVYALNLFFHKGGYDLILHLRNKNVLVQL